MTGATGSPFAGVYDLGEILAGGAAPPAAPSGPGAPLAAARPGTGLPAIRIADGSDRWRAGVGAWLAAQESDNTRGAYRREAARWHAWCEQLGLDPFAVRRRHADVYARQLGGSNASRARALAALSSLHRYLLENEERGEAGDELEANPFASVKRPKVNAAYSPTKALADQDTDKLMAAAKARSPRTHAIVSVLYYTGIRVSELVGAHAEGLGEERGHRTLVIRRRAASTPTWCCRPRPHTRSTCCSTRSPAPLVSPMCTRTGCATPSPSTRRRPGCRSSGSRPRWTTPTRAPPAATPDASNPWRPPPATPSPCAAPSAHYTARTDTPSFSPESETPYSGSAASRPTSGRWRRSQLWEWAADRVRKLGRNAWMTATPTVTTAIVLLAGLGSVGDWKTTLPALLPKSHHALGQPR